ncbi:tRNA nuclease CdiA-2 [Ditylenchus destructor]|uniref:tRNA nuclease CdiA-2 n=1 Tax=Ditylenchus destructor TaxID=166010 RepID=A0AAD4ME64_9BILA|nr:tRNA nuclease CdiA-2 [Ditylenchus destructor]
MYANKIVLIGSEAGLGVRNAGSIGAGAGGLVVTAAGAWRTSARWEGQRVELTTPGDISNHGGTIRQGSSAGLTIASPVLSNTNGGVIGAEPVSADASGGGTATPPASTRAAVEARPHRRQRTQAAPAPAVAPHRRPTHLPHQASSLPVAPSRTTGARSMRAVLSRSIRRRTELQQCGRYVECQPELRRERRLVRQNTGGKLNARSLSITTTGDLLNVDGALTSASDTNLAVGGIADNTRGAISATGALTANVAGAIQNTSGTLASNQNLNVTAGSNLQLNVGQQLLNTSGHISSGGTLAIQTGSLDGSGGNLQSTGDMTITASQALTSTGTNVAGGNATFKGALRDLSGSQTGATNIAITAAQGNVTTSGATVATPARSPSRPMHSPARRWSTTQASSMRPSLQIDASNIANTNGGQIVQTGTGATVLAVSGSIDNSNSQIATNARTSPCRPRPLPEFAGKIDHAGTGTLTIAGGSFNRTAPAPPTLNVGGAIPNNAGTIASNGAIPPVRARWPTRGGKLQAAGASDLNLTVAGQLDNSAAGQILAGGNATVAASSLKNDAGKPDRRRQSQCNHLGAATNAGGTWPPTATPQSPPPA